MQGVVQTAVAKSGKGDVKGAVHAAIQTAVAKSRKGAVQGAVKGAVKGAVQRAVLWFPRWGPSVPTFKNWKFFAMVTVYGSQVGKHEFQPLVTGSCLQW